jgi:hypothetical protein
MANRFDIYIQIIILLMLILISGSSLFQKYYLVHFPEEKTLLIEKRQENTYKQNLVLIRIKPRDIPRGKKSYLS